MQGRTPPRAALLAAALLLAAPAAGAAEGDAVPPAVREELDRLRRAQEELLRTVEAQRLRIEDLEARGRTGGDAPAPAGGDLARTVEDYLKKGVPTRKGSFLRFYGFVRLDAIWDDSSPSNTQTIGWVRSEDPTVAGGADKNDPDFTMHPRLTRLGLDLDGGRVAGLGDAALTGKVEVDFYNSGLAGQAESRAALRMRHAYLLLAGAEGALLAGQTADLISPLWPVVNPDLVNWGAGNLGDRRPQVRYTRTLDAGDGRKATLAGMVGLTGAVDNQNLDGDPFRDGEASGWPTFQGRAAWAMPMAGSNLEIGLWGHWAREGVETPAASETHFQSAAVGLDLLFPLSSTLHLKGEIWRGRNLDDVRGGIFQGVNAATGEEIAAQGGWIEAGWKVAPTVSLAAGFSADNPSSGDLPAGGRDRNRVWYVAARFQFEPLEMGIDFLHWHTSFKGVRGGLDNRVQVFVAYHF